MKREELPKTIKSPITGDTLELKGVDSHNGEELSVAQFTQHSSTEWYDDIVMYRNDDTKELIYVSVDK